MTMTGENGFTSKLLLSWVGLFEVCWFQVLSFTNGKRAWRKKISKKNKKFNQILSCSWTFFSSSWKLTFGCSWLLHRVLVPDGPYLRLAVRLPIGTTSRMWNLNKHSKIRFATLVSHCRDASSSSGDIIITLYRNVPESHGWLVQQNLAR